ncbi:MAG: acetyl-CoA C-acetyltransferase [Pseudomonadota bacterium]
MPDAFIFDHVRTPRGKGKPDGALHEATPLHLATTVLSELRDRNDLDTSHVSDVVMGVVMPIGEQGQVLPRIAAMHAGYAEETAGVQVNRFCGSGLEAVNIGAAKVMAGQSDLTVVGGCESMSRIPILSDGGAWSSDPQASFNSYFVPQGISADLIATKYGYSRERVDTFAVESHRRAARARSEGRFDRSIVPVKNRVGETLLDRDETIRGNSGVSDLEKLNPSFASMGKDAGFDAIARMRYPDVGEIDHVHHAGNSSGIVDGATAMLIGTKEAGDAGGVKPRAFIRAFAEIGSEPTIMLTAPSIAAERALKRAGMTAADIDLYEINEAFAAVALRFSDALDLDPDKVNVNGGAIAMGHPLGATGAMILGTVLDELERTGQSTALATLCIGAGMGVATIIERV